MMNHVQLQVLFEEDKAEKNVTAYIPALRLGVKGDTIEEARENARDLIEMEFEAARQQGRAIPQDTAIIENINVSLPVNK
ncbi:putative RNase H-like HicB family nuclease [Paenibacillus sp. LBL]|uniref:type II toxin-antitoxin system HicB family antitoxin n=1 Tax=Paenibacillus sp. LBL TaxID=2940563 RepID=UPI002476EF95|nr:type II toxin-antitoxin system HicB family antitoxin [Paenibacillus sp. LBL]MDH6675001.1 putative RNase H-like HicB family nuclease [Paenibacillus sp. LBL]